MKNFSFSFRMNLMLLIMGLITFRIAHSQEITYPESKNKAGFTLQEQDRNGVLVSYSVNAFSIVPTEIDDHVMNNIEIQGSWLPNDAGAPNLPGGGKYIAIPSGAVPVLKILSLRKESYQNIEVAPAPRIPLDTDRGPLQYPIRTDIYSRNAFYPANPVTLSAPSKIRGIDVVMLGVTPFQYNPVTKELVVYRKIEIGIEFEGGNGQFGEERLRSCFWDPILEDAILNHASLPAVDYGKRALSGRSDTGADYLIIVPNGTDYMTWATQVKHFRIKQGIATEIRTLNEAGGNNAEDLEAYINTIYSTWDPVPSAILLMGDYGYNTDNNIISPQYEVWCKSDNIFGDVDDDGLPDIVMARMTANNNTQLETCVTKFINYEMNPPTSEAFYDHPITAIGWEVDRWFQINAESIGGYFLNVHDKNPVRINAVSMGNPNTDPWSIATNTEMIIHEFGPSGLGYIPGTPQEIGGFEGGEAIGINNAINNGAFIVLHRDHGMDIGWQVPEYTNADINNLYNTDLPFIFSINCMSGKYNSEEECFTEKIHRYRNNCVNSGALGVISASETSYSFVNDTYVWGLFDYMWPDFMPEYGSTPAERGMLPAFANAAGKYFLEQSNWPCNAQDKEVTYHLFHHHGDAFQTLYSDVPQSLKIMHDAVIYEGYFVFTVEANAGSTICLTVGDDIIGLATGTGNQQPIVIEPQVNETEVILTVTKTNYFRHEEPILVIPAEGAYCLYSAHTVADSQDGNGDGMVDYNETVALSIAMRNVGLEDGNNVTATISTADPFVRMIDNEEFYATIPSGQAVTINNGFSIYVAENTPDQHQALFNLVASDGFGTWTSMFVLSINAPHLHINELTIDDQANGNGNGILDPGEQVEMIIDYSNTGHDMAYDVDVFLEGQSGFIEVLNPGQNFTSIGFMGIFNKTFDVVVDADAPEGITVNFKNELNMGVYYDEKSFIKKIHPVLEDFETGDFEKYDWELSGNQPWVITNEYPYEGLFCAKSGAITELQNSVMELTCSVMEDDSISFIRKVSSEYLDRLKFYINNQLIAEWSGTSVGWRREVFAVTSGNKTFKWVYAKNVAGTSGSDEAWLDNIHLPTPATLTIWAGPNAESCPGGFYMLEEAYGTDYATISWTTSGTGTFDDNTIMQPTYIPGEEDELAGSVTLTLTLTDNGGNIVNDEMVLAFIGGPGAPENIEGPDYVDLLYTCSSDFVTGGVDDIYNYIWYIQPVEAGTIEGNWRYSKVTWNTDFIGTAYITVAGINDCSEGEVSQAFEVTVDNTVGIENLESSKLTIYPNPGTGNYHITLNSECQGLICIKVINQIGRVVYESSHQNKGLLQENLNLAYLSDGIYFLQVEGECVSILKMIVKE
jgi:hypothetical protein